MKRARGRKSPGQQKAVHDNSGTSPKKRKKLNKLAVFGISFAAIIAMSFAVLGFSSLFDKPEEPEGDYVQPVEKATGKVNALVLGVDKQGLLTDTMIVVSYNTDANTVKLLSIPRDTRMYVGTHYQKINAAYAVAHNRGEDGAQGSIEAVTRLTGIPINYYVKFSTTALKDLVDALGGVEFYVPQDMKYDDPVQDLHIDLQEGMQTLDGDKAEQLVRFRSYRDGDIDRVKMQQQFLTAIIEQKLNAGIIAKIPELFAAVQKNIETNAGLAEIMTYAPNLLELKPENITMFQVPGGFNDTDYGASYWIPDMAALRQIVEDEFGYDASMITTGKPGTVESGSGTRATATAKPAEKTEKPEKTTDTEKTNAPKKTQKPTQKATQKPSNKTDTPKKTAEPTKKPVITEEPAETKKPVSTEKPVERTEAPTKAPEKTKEPDKTPQKPTANPTREPEE